MQGLFAGRCRPPVRHNASSRRLRLFPTMEAATSEPSAESDAFQRWAAGAGIRAPKVAQAQFGSLRGFKVLANIPPFEVLITVPRAAALVLTPGQQCPAGLLESGYWHCAPWFIKMALLLLWERRKGSGSRLSGYINQLPKSVDLPMRWTEAEIQELQYHNVIEELRERWLQIHVQQQQWRELYHDLVAALEATPGAIELSWEDYLWAMQNVCSRVYTERYPGIALKERLLLGGAALAVALGCLLWQHSDLVLALGMVPAALALNFAYDALLSQQKLHFYAMVPLVDGINHQSSVASRMVYNFAGDCFKLSVDRAFARGQQVFQKYAPYCNDSLLMYYGFVEPSNPHDTYLLAVPVAGQSITVCIDAKGKADAGGLEALRAALAEDQGPAMHQLQQQLQWAPGGDVWQAIAEACQQELARLPTTAAEDEALLQAPQGLCPRTSLGIAFRLEKKRLLSRCIEQVVTKGQETPAMPAERAAAECS